MSDIDRPSKTSTSGSDGERARTRLSMVDVAAHAGVSLGTVSNVLNRPELVAERTQRRVRSSIAALGFVPNAPARQLRGGRSRTVGVVVREIGSPYFSEMLPGIESKLAKEQFLLMVCSSDDSPDKEAYYLKTLEEHRVAGILISPAGDDIEHLIELRQRGVGVVLLDRLGVGSQLCAVAVNNVQGGDLAGDHLFSLGHRRVGFLNGPSTVRQCADRREGLHRAARRAGLDPDEAISEITLSVLNAHGGETGLAQLLDDERRPSAIFCINDMVAVGVLRDLEKRGIAAPGEMSVVGYDDVEFAALLSPALTSIRMPKQQLGQAAAELLVTDFRADDDHWHQEIVFQPELIIRASTSPPPTSG